MLRIALPLVLTLFVLVPPAIAASPTVPPPQTLHIVRAGETLWTIAQSHRLPPDLLAQVNRLPDPNRLQIGDRVAIPAAPSAAATAEKRAPTATPDGAVHLVVPGETLWNIARRHGTAVETLVRLNGLSDPDPLRPGQRVRLPAAAAASLQKRSVPGRRAIAPAPALRPRWPQWPSRGIITSRFGFRGRHHHGIDIAAPVGTPIYAVQAGRVKFVGRMGGYGLLVILDHGGGLTTWYGHASRILVAVGDEIRQGQAIAAVGTTGNVSGPNVHFELRRNDVPLDPLKFLQVR